MSIVFTKINYSETDKNTIAPVSRSEPFYQETHQLKKCSIHSMNHLAGRHIVDVGDLLHINNEYNLKIYEKMCDASQLKGALKNLGMYLETLEDLEKAGGITVPPIQIYMEQHRTDFNFPQSSIIQSSSWGVLDSEKIQNAFKYVETNRLHRVVVSITGTIDGKTIGHLITIRQDETRSWRVLDSMVYSHNPQAVSLVDQLQPSSSTLQEAIKGILPKYEAEKNDIRLLYPSKDVSLATLKTVEALDLPYSINSIIDEYVSET